MTNMLMDLSMYILVFLYWLVIILGFITVALLLWYWAYWLAKLLRRLIQGGNDNE